MKSPLILGMDIGTSVCKVGICNEQGFLLGCEQFRYGTVKGKGGVVEQDAHEWWNAAVRSTTKLLKTGEVDTKSIAAISLCSQGITFVPVDHRLEPTSRALSWLDTRAEEETEEILEHFGLSEMFRITGKRVHASYSLPKVLWLKKNRPHLLDHSEKLLMSHDYVVARLTGACVTDHTLASGSLMYDISALNWSEDIMNEFRIPVEKLPSIEWAGSLCGELSKTAAEITGLPRGIPVFVGGQDQKCADLAAQLSHGIGTLSLGTAVVVTTATDRPVIDEKMRVPCFPYLRESDWVLEAVIATGGASLDWLSGLLPTKRYSHEKLIGMAAGSPMGAQGVSFFPHLSGATSPHWKSVRGAFCGLSLSVEMADVVRAVLEGIAFQVRQNVEVLEDLAGQVRELRVFGGGARSRLWTQILADVVGKPICVLSTEQVALVGACVLAGVSTNVYETPESIGNRLCSYGRRLAPDPNAVNRYQEFFESYCEKEKALMDEAEG